MHDRVLQHVRLEKELVRTRGRLALGDLATDAAEEDRILDELDTLWRTMTAQERAYLERHWPLRNGEFAPRAPGTDLPARDVANHDRRNLPARLSVEAA